MGSCGGALRTVVPAFAAVALLLVAGCSGGGGGGGQVAATAPSSGPSPPPEPPFSPAGPPGRGPERLAYTAPTGAAGAPVDQRVGRPPARVFDQVQPALRGAGLRISHLDERAGLVVATFSGDPARFVDCGTIAARPADGGGERRLEAAAEQLAFRRGDRRRPALVERGLSLNARLVLQLRPDAGGAGATRLRSRATYVLSKRTAVEGGGEARVETIGFESGRRASFAKGTTCQPTGALERLALVSAGT